MTAGTGIPPAVQRISATRHDGLTIEALAVYESGGPSGVMRRAEVRFLAVRPEKAAAGLGPIEVPADLELALILPPVALTWACLMYLVRGAEAGAPWKLTGDWPALDSTPTGV